MLEEKAEPCQLEGPEPGQVLVLRGMWHMQAHELSSASLRCLSRASQLEALALEGMQVVGTAGWSALAQLTRLTSLAVRSRGDNSGLHHVSPSHRLHAPSESTSGTCLHHPVNGLVRLASNAEDPSRVCQHGYQASDWLMNSM